MLRMAFAIAVVAFCGSADAHIASPAQRPDSEVQPSSTLTQVADYYDRNKFEAEAFDTRKALAEADVRRAESYMHRGDYANAVVEYSHALKLSPKWIDALTGRASAYGHLTQYEDAIRDYDSAIALAAEDAPSLSGRCFYRAVAGNDFDAALADCNAALALDPTDASFLDSRGFLYFRMGNNTAALADLNAALARNPKLASSLYVRGIIRLKESDAAGSSDIDAAKALDPHVAETYAGYGVKP